MVFLIATVLNCLFMSIKLVRENRRCWGWLCLAARSIYLVPGHFDSVLRASPTVYSQVQRVRLAAQILKPAPNAFRGDSDPRTRPAMKERCHSIRKPAESSTRPSRGETADHSPLSGGRCVRCPCPLPRGTPASGQVIPGSVEEGVIGVLMGVFCCFHPDAVFPISRKPMAKLSVSASKAWGLWS